MTDFICQFSLQSTFLVLAAFTTIVHASAQKSSATYTQIFRHLYMDLVKLIFILVLKNIYRLHIPQT